MGDTARPISSARTDALAKRVKPRFLGLFAPETMLDPNSTQPPT